MATVILVRHGRTTANASGVLAGRMPGVQLDDVGHQQARATAKRLADVPLSAVVSSPLERCQQTAAEIVDAHRDTLQITTDDAITECDYGTWQGQQLGTLVKEDLWPTVQNHPAAVTFPGGESMRLMQHRAVEAIRRRDAAIHAEHGPSAVWVAVSHGDIIKAILADALGSHLDAFQRIVVNPASVSIINYTSARPHVLTMNTDAGDLSWLGASTPADDAPIGGGAGHPAPAENRS
jgi:probable phosphomutase (TIGR03848 family)